MSYTFKGKAVRVEGATVHLRDESGWEVVLRGVGGCAVGQSVEFELIARHERREFSSKVTILLWLAVLLAIAVLGWLLRLC